MRGLLGAHVEDEADRRWVRERETESGMVRIEAQLTPEEAAVVRAAIELAMKRAWESGEVRPEARDVSAETSQRTGNSGPDRAISPTLPPTLRRADALIAVAEAYLAKPADSAAPPVEIVVHVDADALRNATSEDCATLDDGTPISRATTDRLACDATLRRVIEDSRGNPLDVARRRRTIPNALKRALRLRDRGCRFPGCSNRHIDGHHVVPWSRGGETRLGNLLSLCRRHHRFVHEYGFRVTATSDGAFSFFRPNGRAVKPCGTPPRSRRIPSARSSISHATAGLSVDARTNFPRLGRDATRLRLDRRRADEPFEERPPDTLLAEGRGGDQERARQHGTSCDARCRRVTCATESDNVLLACTSYPPEVAVTALPGGFLFVYSELSSSQTTHVAARRLDATAQIVEPAPLVVSNDVAAPLATSSYAPSVTQNGSSYYVAWETALGLPAYEFRGRIVPATGAITGTVDTIAAFQVFGQCGTYLAGPLGLAPTLDSMAIHATFRQVFYCYPGGVLFENLVGLVPGFFNVPPPGNVSTGVAPLARGASDVAGAWWNIAVPSLTPPITTISTVHAAWIEPGPADCIPPHHDRTCDEPVPRCGRDTFLAVWAARAVAEDQFPSEVRAMRFSRAAGATRSGWRRAAREQRWRTGRPPGWSRAYPSSTTFWLGAGSCTSTRSSRSRAVGSTGRRTRRPCGSIPSSGFASPSAWATTWISSSGATWAASVRGRESPGT